jgi:hypothetical protein
LPGAAALVQRCSLLTVASSKMQTYLSSLVRSTLI